MPTFIKRANSNTVEKLRFVSTVTLEQELDKTYEKFNEFFFAIYHCSYAENSGIKERREQLRKTYPNKIIQVGEYFVLTGEAAYLALSTYYHALLEADTLSEEYKDYIKQRLEEIKSKHIDSQSLPFPIDLTEGQLSRDKHMELMACIAIMNRQIISSSEA